MQSLQEVIEDAVKKFVLQGHRCVRIVKSGWPICMYGNGTDRCIVGHALPVDLFDLVKDYFGSVEDVVKNYPVIDDWFRSFPEIKDTDYKYFWRSFQSLHDTAMDEPYYFKSKLTRFLEEHNLSTRFVDDLDFSNWNIGV